MAYPETMSEIANYPKALSHAESGGGITPKVLNVTVSADSNLSANIQTIEGNYYANTVIGIGETKAVKYIAWPEETDFAASIALNTLGETTIVTGPEGVEIANGKLVVGATVADGAAVTLKIEGSGGTLPLGEGGIS